MVKMHKIVIAPDAANKLREAGKLEEHVAESCVEAGVPVAVMHDCEVHGARAIGPKVFERRGGKTVGWTREAEAEYERIFRSRSN